MPRGAPPRPCRPAAASVIGPLRNSPPRGAPLRGPPAKPDTPPRQRNVGNILEIFCEYVGNILSTRALRGTDEGALRRQGGLGAGRDKGWRVPGCYNGVTSGVTPVLHRV
eukprot:2405524-Pyramimonas_sp.AAC.1